MRLVFRTRTSVQAEAPLFYGFNNSTKGSLNKLFFVVTFCDMGDYTTAVERADDGRRMMCTTAAIHIVRRPPNNHLYGLWVLSLRSFSFGFCAFLFHPFGFLDFSLFVFVLFFFDLRDKFFLLFFNLSFSLFLICLSRFYIRPFNVFSLLVHYNKACRRAGRRFYFTKFPFKSTFRSKGLKSVSTHIANTFLLTPPSG